MDIFHWILQHKKKFVIIIFILIIVIPFLIDKLMNIPAVLDFIGVSYSSADILSFYGVVLGGIATILALIETIQHAENIHAIDYERKLTPMLNSNLYLNDITSKVPFRTRYVNVRPSRIFDTIDVFKSLDPRDLKDTFIFTQIDYLVQNISETSAVDIKIYINEKLLCDPFSLIAGSELSIGIRFFEVRGVFPGEFSYNLKIEYTNCIKSKNYQQCETIFIQSGYAIFDHKPIEPIFEKRTGLSMQAILD